MRNTILLGDVRQTLAQVPAGTVQCCVTSPPYWNLRSYLDASHPDKPLEIGSEPTIEAYIETLVGVFRECRRVLRDDGTLWLNCGDSYDANGSKLGMPWRLAFALQADGWLLRDEIIWAKPSPMPSSQNGWRWERCRIKAKNGAPQAPEFQTGRLKDHSGDIRNTDAAEWIPCPGCPKCLPHGGLVLRRAKWRTTTAHEPIFMFAKSEGYFCDPWASKESAVGDAPGNKRHKGAEAYANGDEHHRTKVGLTNVEAVKYRTARSVWKISTEPTKLKHFACFPSELARRCIIAGSSPQACSKCGAPYAPLLRQERVPTRPGVNNKIWKGVDANGNGQRSDDSPNLDPERHVLEISCDGYLPSCGCKAEPGRCVVLDPFSGTSTTCQVARHFGRDWIGCEINSVYAEMGLKKINETPACVKRLQKKKPPPKQSNQMEMFT